MNTQRDWIDTFFSRMSPNSMIDKLSIEHKFNCGYLRRSLLEKMNSEINHHLQDCYSTSSKDEREEIVHWGVEQAYPDTNYYLDRNLRGPFKHILDFGRAVLIEQDEKPYCRFESMLRWRMLSHRIDQDTLVCAFLADQDLNRGIARSNFTWEPVIKTDNIRLHNMLKKGMAENHFHLYGSGPHFQLNWLSLMNKPSGRKQEYASSGIGKNHLESRQYYTDASLNNADTLETLVKKAALIRLYLFENLNGIKSSLDKKELFRLLRLPENIMKLEYGKYTSIINSHRLIKGFLFSSKAVGRPDYALSNALAYRNFNHNLFLASERKLLYDCFTNIYKAYSDDSSKCDEDVFYIYLLIKAYFRAEMVQVNERHGFMNFSDYQNRKDKFIESEAVYMEALTYMAVASSYKDQNIVSLEARITPKKDAITLNNSIRAIDEVIERGNHLFSTGLPNEKYTHFIDELKSPVGLMLDKNPLFYVIHMAKGKDTESVKMLINLKTDEERRLKIRPRNHEIRKKSEVTYRQIEKSRYYRNYAAFRIYGIDACSNEVGCRPEVFAHAIRATRNLSMLQTTDVLLKKTAEQLPTIRVTYHAGEDYLDPVDGMRAIDEAVLFNQMRYGDRIGHALALGVDVMEWYACKRHNIVLPKQDYIDNLAWMMKKIMDYRIPTDIFVLEKLRSEFKRFCDDVYDIGEVITNDEYSRAWLLRGDHPECYRIKDQCQGITNVGHWANHAINGTIEAGKQIRTDKTVLNICHSYHYSPEVRIKGSERCNVVVSKDYMIIASAIQNAMQFDLRQKGIGIECNPSSNYLIGSFKRYDKHPIVNFFNLGLTYNAEAIQKCPQLFVSINTDDQGIFGTYLENEFAIMALALEKCKDSDGKLVYNQEMIYDWLDRVRNMGIQQSFRLNVKNLV